MNSDGTGLEEVGVDAGGGRESIFAIYHPSVSPDGKKIAFSTMRFRVTSKTEDSWTYSPGLPDIWVENIDGFGAVNLTDSPTQIDYHPSWSPDGKWITYGSKERLNGNANIWIMNLQNSNRFQLTDESSECHSPYWSPR